MNKIQNRLLLAFMATAIAAAGATSCGGKEEANKPAAGAKAAKVDPSKLPNYRYVDLDTLLSRYNLAKDYNEEMVRMQNNYESTVRSHQSRIQQFGTSVQQKMQNNGYLSEASYKADEQKMASMHNEAQRQVSTLENNMQKAMMDAQKTVNDSITKFIEEYNATRGYDAILYKNATLYINPALDITNEVVEGLNARYNKVKK